MAHTIICTPPLAAKLRLPEGELTPLTAHIMENRTHAVLRYDEHGRVAIPVSVRSFTSDLYATLAVAINSSNMMASHIPRLQGTPVFLPNSTGDLILLIGPCLACVPTSITLFGTPVTALSNIIRAYLDYLRNNRHSNAMAVADIKEALTIALASLLHNSISLSDASHPNHAHARNKFIVSIYNLCVHTGITLPNPNTYCNPRAQLIWAQLFMPLLS